MGKAEGANQGWSDRVIGVIARLGDFDEGTGFGARDSGFGKDATPEIRNPSFQCARIPRITSQ